jgi:hypothetical protein
MSKPNEFKSFRRGRDLDIDPRTRINKSLKEYNRAANKKIEIEEEDEEMLDRAELEEDCND